MADDLLGVGAGAVPGAQGERRPGGRRPPGGGQEGQDTSGQSLVRYASTARWRNEDGFPRRMIPREESRRWAVVTPASAPLAKPISAAMRVSVRSSGSSSAITSTS